MRLARLYVTLALAILASCEEPAANDETTTIPTVYQEEQLENVEKSEDTVETDEDNDTLKIQDPLDPKNSKLPILPPLILLDFGNDDDNSTSGEEKSKRTVDGNLGYGFARNDLFSGKSNYYFPAGKSGTTVSIEESISPFQPKTIIESVKPISEKPYPGDQNNAYGQNPLQHHNYQLAGQSANRQQVQRPINQPNNIPYSQQIFGQRTKLYKPSQIDYSAYQSFSTTPKSTIETYTTTSRPDYRSNGFTVNQNSFTTPKPAFSTGSFTTRFPQATYTTQRPFVSYTTSAPPSYVTPTSSSYQSRYTVNPADSFSTPRPSFDGITPTPTNFGSQSYTPESPLASFANLPRYTIENGVRYENKIVWKYADGKISQTPPTSYINAYNEFLSKQNPGAAPQTSSYMNIGSASGFPNSRPSGVYQNPGGGLNYQNFPSHTSFQNPNYQSQVLRYPSSQQTRYPAESLGNIYSKSPAQFPNDQEPNKRPSPFVSSASLQSANFGVGSRAPPIPQGQSDELGYESQFGLKTPQRFGNFASSTGSSTSYTGLLNDNTKLLKDAYRTSYEKERLIPKYEVNSPNPEYTFSTESSLKSSTPSSSSLLTPSGTLSPNILSKYSTQAQKYLSKVFTPERTSTQNYQATSPSSAGLRYSTPSTPYINTDYENLLNYNPSISQYIRNPSSILKAQPTYIQAGNSLIPVIILRVDGAPPIQPKITPNINLKALLQQYLTQYAGSLSQNGNNNFGNSGNYGKTPSSLYHLNQLAQSLSQYSQDPSIANSFANQFEGNPNQSAYETSNSFPTRTSYDDSDKTGGIKNYGSRTNKPQKIKSVQIIEDPRFTSYKVNS